MSVRKRGKNYLIDLRVNGKRIQKIVGPSKREAQSAEAKLKEEARKGEFFGFSGKSVLFTNLVKRHLQAFRVKRSYQTEVVLLKAATERWKYAKADQISPYDIVEFRGERLATQTRNGTKRKASTCNREISALHRVFQSAVEWGLIRKNPVRGIKPLEEERGRSRFLSLDEAKSLLVSSPPHLAPIIGVALGTGMRRGEILGLKWIDVDFGRNLIYVRQSSAKTGVARHVPMSGAVKRILFALPRRGAFVFCDERGNPYKDNRTAFETACARAGIRNFRFHDLRHTAASYMVMSGVPMRTVGDILGHRTETMTERYSHLLPEHRLDAVESLPDWREND